MKQITNVAIIGAGAMGAAYASRFFDAPGFSTVLVARDHRCDLLKTQGLTVNGKHYSIPVVHPDEKPPAADLVLVALKAHHLSDAVNDLKNLVGDDTQFVSVMNGLDSEERLGAVYGMDKVLYAIAVGIDALRQGPSVTYTNPGKIYFGEAENSVPAERVLRVREAFDRAGIASEIPADMMRMLWWKFMINVGINQASAVMRVPYGIFQSSPDAQALMKTLMREVVAVAHRAGVNLGEKDIDDWSGVLNTLSPHGKTSMLQDIEAGRKTEVESFAGTMVELSRKYAVPAPANEVLFSIIRVLEQSAT